MRSLSSMTPQISVAASPAFGAVHATSGSTTLGRWFRQNSVTASLTVEKALGEYVSHRSGPGAAATIARTASENEVGSGRSFILILRSTRFSESAIMKRDRGYSIYRVHWASQFSSECNPLPRGLGRSRTSLRTALHEADVFRFAVEADDWKTYFSGGLYLPFLGSIHHLITLSLPFGIHSARQSMNRTTAPSLWR